MSQTVKYFDPDRFHSQWARSTDRQKAVMVSQSALMPPEQGIEAALEGYFHTSAQVRDCGQTALEALTRSLSGMPAGTGEASPGARAVSARVSACIYGRLAAMPPNGAQNAQRGFLAKRLADMGGQGPAALFMAIVRGHISAQDLETLCPDMTEAGRLSLTGHYLQATPEIRHTLAPAFRTLLTSVRSRSEVLRFYADLFDRGQDSDPFLSHLRPELRNPQKVMAKELPSARIEERILGLKALSMLLNRIPQDILEPVLSLAQPPEIRTVAYQIVKNAAPGAYAGLFDPILALLPCVADSEALEAFKALAATGRQAMSVVLDSVQENRPGLMPEVKLAMADLSKTGFLAIQDMALNPGRYKTGLYLDINLACIFGMVKKRPERVAAVIRNSPDRNRADSEKLDRFLRHVDSLLEKEKKDIAAPLIPVLIRLKTLETTPPAETPEDGTLKVGKIMARVFSGDIPGTGGRADFMDQVLEDCCFSGASLTGCACDRAVIRNTDVRNAVFDSVSFDKSAWINVDARGAVFRNCRFDSALIFHSDFSDAVVTDCFFTRAQIVGTRFTNTEISFSSFALARLSGVLLDKAKAHVLDFSGVRARFSRFPRPESLGAADIEYNARAYQPALSDLPPLDQALIRKINLLIFCEFTHYGEGKFIRQNRLSQLTAFDIFTTRPADLFMLIPLLVHTNLPFPGTEPVPDRTPCGIEDFLPSPEALRVYAAHAGGPAPARAFHPSPAILGLYTIGSVGSVAQTSDSDIDLWVCIDEPALDNQDRSLLEAKLASLEAMAGQYFNTQVTFFIVDITRVKGNNFGDSTLESSGSAQAGILKEEFYRTMIHLAGRLPLWMVLPTPISQRYYPAIAKSMAATRRYLDLGDIHDIPKGEYFGACIWQMFKWLKSPFKSILKMALLEKYIFDPPNQPLLCNQYKNEWMNTGARLKLAQNDAYFFLMKHLLRFYETTGDVHSVNLLLTCFFLKLKIKSRKELSETVSGLRYLLISKCLDTWGWEMRKALEVGHIRTWPYKNIVRLSRTLETYILNRYKKVTTACQTDGIMETMISAQDRTVLEHKVKIEFSAQPMKVRKILLVSRGDRHFSKLYLKCLDTAPPGGKWALFNQAEASDELILKADSLEEIGAWLVVNELFSPNTRIRLLSSPFPVTEAKVNTLYCAIQEFFSDKLKSPPAFEQLLAYPKKTALFVSVNFYAPGHQAPVTHYTVLSFNAWNEIFCHSGYAPMGFLSMSHVTRDLMFRLRTRQLPEPIVFFHSDGADDGLSP